MIRLAFDIGGTFTDFVLHDGVSGQAWTFKVPSTPEEPQRAVLEGIEALLLEAGLRPGEVGVSLHATTVATNAVLERKGAATGLITTEGFRDVLLIGRQKRYEIYDLYIEKPRPLVRRRHIAEIAERVAFDGEVVMPLDEASVDGAVTAMLESGREAVAVCLMHAYSNPAHEQAVAARINQLAPHLSVSLSSDVSPKYREYERTSTTVANAYVKPIVSRYLGELAGALSELGCPDDLYVMQSNGGLVSPEVARETPIRIIESGPAAGVLLGQVVGSDIGETELVTFDMGGTTAKLGAIDGGEPAIMPTFEIDHRNYRKGSGLPINVPAVELLEIGAGGGSIARIEMGMIAVGPRSAGADPGPICYGQGGTEPTVTDANLVLGYLPTEGFNAGRMRLDLAGARAGIETVIAGPLGLTVEEAAWGIHLVATTAMENAMRIVSVERGRDPRGYTMIAFGGAGPIHASRLARSIGIPRVVIPRGAGVGSAVGMLAARSKVDATVTRILEVEPRQAGTMADVYAELEGRVRADLERLGAQGDILWRRSAQLRYAGQGFELQVSLPDGPIDEAFPAQVKESFDRAYLRKHRFLDEQGRVEAVDWTLTATVTAQSEQGAVIRIDDAQSHGASPPSSRPAYFPEQGGFVDTPVLNRADLSSDAVRRGPVIIEDPDATVVVLPGDTIEVRPGGHLLVTVHGATSETDT